MFDNVAFNVVIGLVFIYLLYSLLITILGEIMSTQMGIRARLLRVAIERMLNDGYYQKVERKKGKWWQGWLRRTFLYEPEEFKVSFAGIFYDSPAIKYLGRIEDDYKGRFSSTKPSYISADYFSNAIINFLAEKGVGTTQMDRIGFCLTYNTYHIQPRTLKQFRNLFENAGGSRETYKQNLIRWFNETMDRCTGWHKHKMRVISIGLGFIVAAGFNLDTIRIAKILANDKEARNQLVTMGVAMAKDSTRYKNFVSAKGDTLRTESIIDTGFARVVQDINAANLVLGLGWNLTDSLYSDKISHKPGKDERDQLKKSVDSLHKLNAIGTDIAAHLHFSSIQLAISQNHLNTLHTDSLISANQVQFATSNSMAWRTWKDKLQQSHRQILLVQTGMKSILLQRKIDSSALKTNEFLTRTLLADINQHITGSNLAVIDSVSTPGKDGTSLIFGKRPYTRTEKLYYILIHIVWYNFASFLITALALSLGAPFWFDVLNKLIAIRGVGVKPEEKKVLADEAVSIPDKKNDVTVSNSPSVNDPVDIAFRVYADQIRREKGVVNVTQSCYFENSLLSKCIQVNVENDVAAVEVKTKYSTHLRIAENTFIYMNVLVTGKPALSAGFPDGLGHTAKGICNKISRKNIGSYGCLVRKLDDRKKTFLLSCYHVMNADLTWDNREVEQDIINHLGIVSSRYEGYLTSFMDTALAEITDQKIIDLYRAGLDCKVPGKIREVKAADVFKTKVLIEGFNSKSSTGLLVNDSSTETFDYPRKGAQPFPHVLNDLIVISHREKDFPDFSGTSPGDSGTIILDEDLKALGIVVGSDLLHTYAIKVDTIFNFLGLELITT
ncbi:MAG: hypothetical protein INR73_17640 [Williamsia sp.]|nr:hypothetical protein [Williamsia sp.]